MNPEVTVPLTIRSAAADFEEGQVLAAGFFTSLRVAADGRGPAAIGVQDAQPKRLFRCLPCTRIRDRVGRGHAPWQVLVTDPRVDGELEAVRIGAQAADSDGHLIGADHRHRGRGYGRDYPVRP